MARCARRIPPVGPGTPGGLLEIGSRGVEDSFGAFIRKLLQLECTSLMVTNGCICTKTKAISAFDAAKHYLHVSFTIAQPKAVYARGHYVTATPNHLVGGGLGSRFAARFLRHGSGGQRENLRGGMAGGAALPSFAGNRKRRVPRAPRGPAATLPGDAVEHPRGNYD